MLPNALFPFHALVSLSLLVDQLRMALIASPNTAEPLYRPP
jgi:hypothetical protein